LRHAPQASVVSPNLARKYYHICTAEAASFNKVAGTLRFFTFLPGFQVPDIRLFWGPGQASLAHPLGPTFLAAGRRIPNGS